MVEERSDAVSGGRCLRGEVRGRQASACVPLSWMLAAIAPTQLASTASVMRVGTQSCE